jgi:hypothetical protein
LFNYKAMLIAADLFELARKKASNKITNYASLF